MWISAAAALPLFMLIMGERVVLPVRNSIVHQGAIYLECVPATPIILWAALQFFQRGSDSVVNRRPAPDSSRGPGTPGSRAATVGRPIGRPRPHPDDKRRRRRGKRVHCNPDPSHSELTKGHPAVSRDMTPRPVTFALRCIMISLRHSVPLAALIVALGSSPEAAAPVRLLFESNADLDGGFGVSTQTFATFGDLLDNTSTSLGAFSKINTASA